MIPAERLPLWTEAYPKFATTIDLALLYPEDFASFTTLWVHLMVSLPTLRLPVCGGHENFSNLSDICSVSNVFSPMPLNFRNSLGYIRWSLADSPVLVDLPEKFRT